jgi:hypothetical protein
MKMTDSESRWVNRVMRTIRYVAFMESCNSIAGLVEKGASEIILPGNERHDRAENLGKQFLKPSSGRCKVVELRRVRLNRAFQQLDQVLAKGLLHNS